jgi:Tfp pilus assembly protein FimT
VVVTILGVMAGVTGVALRAARQADEGDRLASIVAAARSLAIRSGRSVTVEVRAGSATDQLTALADGSVIAPKALNVDRLTGRVSRERR